MDDLAERIARGGKAETALEALKWRTMAAALLTAERTGNRKERRARKTKANRSQP